MRVLERERGEGGREMYADRGIQRIVMCLFFCRTTHKGRQTQSDGSADTCAIQWGVTVGTFKGVAKHLTFK